MIRLLVPAIVLAVLMSGCPGPANDTCLTRSDCDSETFCRAGRCVPPASDDRDRDGSSPCTGSPIAGSCDCDDSNAARHPDAEDICGNGIDEDCSGQDSQCDADGDGFAADVDCDDTSPDVHPGGAALEQCCAAPPCEATCTCNGIDDNCNGLVDEHATCLVLDLDGDGSDGCEGATPDCAACDCNDCDPGIHPGAVDQCGNGIDEDGIGGDAICAASDADGDGVVSPRDCSEGDPRTFLDAPEDCGTPASESCGSGACSVDADLDGYGPTGPGIVDCDDTDPEVHPWAVDVCNGVNDDCDADADEVLDPTGTLGCALDETCDGGGRCEVSFETNLHHCGGCRIECNVGATIVADSCISGACSCSTSVGSEPCASGETCCGATNSMGEANAFPGCADLQDDSNNCGGCGVVCGAGTVCTDGTCG